VVAIVSLLLVLVLSLLVVRVATVALTLTGLSRELARFQARSAFTGSGFTTNESEKVVQHPVRRRIIMLLMLLGNAGIITAMSSLILTFVSVDEGGGFMNTVWFRMVVLVLGLTLLWAVAHSELVDRQLSRYITRALKRWTDLELRDYAGLLHLAGDYRVVEMHIERGDWLAHRTLAELKLSDEGVLALGVEKADGSYVGAPRGRTRLEPDDTLLLYGRGNILSDLDQRQAGSAGNWAHHRAVDQQQQIEAQEAVAQEQEQNQAAEPNDADRPL
jgi:hypothetical protein